MPKKLTLAIPQINDEMFDHNKLFQLGNKIHEDTQDVILDFSKCTFIKNNAVAYLGGLVKLIEARGGTVKIDVDSIPAKTKSYLSDNNFLAHCGFEIPPRNENIIPIRHDDMQNTNSYIDYLYDNWLGNRWVQFSNDLKDAIINKLLEIYLNAYEHSTSSIGTVSCGHYYPNLKVLKLTLVDFGIGLVKNVRQFDSNSNMTVAEAFKWAFSSGTSTKTDEKYGRGNGLDVLKSFIYKNSGKIEVYSNNGYALMHKGKSFYPPFNETFDGTLVNITIQCDEKYYDLDSLI